MRELKIAIIGGGSVGRTFSVLLQNKSHDVYMVESRKLKSISIGQSSLVNIAGDFGKMSKMIKIVPKIDDLPKDIDVIIVCTKVNSGSNVLKQIRKLMNENTIVVTIQNMFWIDRASVIIPPSNLVFAVVDFCCARSGRSTFVRNDDGIKLGIINSDAYSKMQIIHDVFKNICHIKEEKDIISFVLSRNLINIAIAMLGAVSGMNLGEVLGDRIGKKMFCHIIKEGLTLFDSFGVKVANYNKQWDYYLFVKKTIEGEHYRKRMIKLLRKNNYNVTSSILQDLETNSESEMLVVIKTFIKHAQVKKISIPHIIKLYKMINEIKHGERRIDKKAFKEIKK